MHYYLTLRRAQNSYLFGPSKPIFLCYLGYFLANDVRDHALEFIEWFKDPSNDAGSGNMTDYSIDEGIMTILPEWEPDYDYCIREGYYFSIKFELVLEILRQWDPVYKAKPPYIIITIIDDVVEVKGCDTCPEDLDLPKEEQ